MSEFPCNKDPSSANRGSHKCPTGSSCTEWEDGPNFGLTSFDNFGNGLLTVFQLITLEGWSGVFYLVCVCVRVHASVRVHACMYPLCMLAVVLSGCYGPDVPQLYMCVLHGSRVHQL